MFQREMTPPLFPFTIRRTAIEPNGIVFVFTFHYSPPNCFPLFPFTIHYSLFTAPALPIHYSPFTIHGFINPQMSQISADSSKGFHFLLLRFTHSPIHLFARSYPTHSPIHPHLLHPLTHSPALTPPIHPLTHSPIHRFTRTYSTHSPIHQFTRS